MSADRRPEPVPRLPMHVCVACSTSNLGPGFDVAGLALSLHLRATVRARSADEPLLAVRGSAAADWPLGEENLLLVALRRAERELRASFGPLALEVESDIPVARGLGSSGAAIAAGLLLGAGLAGARVPRETLLAWAIAIEGHPDNVAASLYGGLTLCIRAEPPLVVRSEVHPRLAFALAWPDRRLPTAEARAVLPRQVPFADAVENARRLPFLLEGLRTGRPELLALGQDRLHVPYRLPLIAGSPAALEAAVHSGALLATISGSGSALLAVAAPERAEEAARAMATELERAGARAEWRVLWPALGAPEVV